MAIRPPSSFRLHPSSFPPPPLLYFAHRTTPESHWTDLNIDLIEWPQQIRVAAEDQLNEFRASQIQLVLKEDRKTYSITGGDEIAVFDRRPKRGLTPRWAGTVDPAEIRRDDIRKRLTLRVLQHGSLLNTVFAGLADWYIDDNGELVTNPETYYRYRGTADNWVTRFNEDNTFGHNEIDTEDAEIFYTPSAKAALEDSLYRSKFAERVWHFHTAGPNVGDVEWPFPNLPPRNVENGSIIWTGQFQQHYRPDFTKRPELWDNQGGIVPDYGAYLRNPESTLPLRRRSIQALLTEFVAQFNRTARFPLAFDPATDCVVIPPVIDAEIELLERSPDVENVDIQHYPATALTSARTLLIVNWIAGGDDPQTLRFSLYEIVNETELSLVADRIAIPHLSNTYTWPNQGRGMRFARATTPSIGETSAFLYTMRWNLNNLAQHYTLQFDVHFGALGLSSAGMSAGLRMFHQRINEQLGEFDTIPLPPLYETNRSARLDTAGNASVRLGTSPYTAYPPEFDPQQSLDIDGRSYRYNNSGVTVSGALFDRVAVDAENARLSSLISDLAKLTNSRWWITSDRTLKFISRTVAGTQRNIPTESLRRPAESYTRSFAKEPAPTISGNLVLPNNFRDAYNTWFEDHIQPTSVRGNKLAVTLSDFPELELADEIILPGTPPSGAPDAVKTIDFVGDNTIEITTEQTLTL